MMMNERLLREWVREALIFKIVSESKSSAMGSAYEAKVQKKLNNAGIGVPGRRGAGAGHGADVVMKFRDISVGVEAKTTTNADIGQANITYDRASGDLKWTNPNDTTAEFDTLGVLSAVKKVQSLIDTALDDFNQQNLYVDPQAIPLTGFPASMFRTAYDNRTIQSLELARQPLNSSAIMKHYGGKGEESSSYIQIGRTASVDDLKAPPKKTGKFQKKTVQQWGKGKGLYVLGSDEFGLQRGLGLPVFSPPKVYARIRLKSPGGRPRTTVSLNVAIKVSADFSDSPINLEKETDTFKVADYILSSVSLPAGEWVKEDMRLGVATDGKIYSSNVITEYIRETLLLEALTKTDRRDIERIARKQAAVIIKRDALDKQEIEKLATKKAEEAIKKALGVSFIGTRGDINKFVADNAEKGAEKWLKDKAGKQQVADVTKLIFKKLYKQLAVTSPQIIDRIKV